MITDSFLYLESSHRSFDLCLQMNFWLWVGFFLVDWFLFSLGFFVVCLVWFWSVVFCFGGGFFVGWSGFFGFCLFLVAFSPLGRRC